MNLSTVVDSLVTVLGPLGSPYWWLMGAVAASVFLATWARAVRTLLPFIGAGTIIVLILWTLVKLNILYVNL